MKKIGFAILSLALFFSACEKEIAIKLPPEEQAIVIEAYINNHNHLGNYVIVSKTVDYFDPQLEALVVHDAEVFITEGDVSGNDTVWDQSTRTQLYEINVGFAYANVYFNPDLRGHEGKYYLLEVTAEGKKIRGVTQIPKVVPLDTVKFSQEIKTYTDRPNDTIRNMSYHFTDPPGRGNCYKAMFDRNPPVGFYAGYGALGDGALLNDDFSDGNRIFVKFGKRFNPGDTVHVYFTSITRPTYRFWDSYSASKSNNGPFATPVQLSSTVSGAIGSFSGYGIYHEVIYVK